MLLMLLCLRGGWDGGHIAHLAHVALFMHTVFHRNLFQLEYYMSVHYKRADIIKDRTTVLVQEDLGYKAKCF